VQGRVNDREWLGLSYADNAQQEGGLKGNWVARNGDREEERKAIRTAEK